MRSVLLIGLSLAVLCAMHTARAVTLEETSAVAVVAMHASRRSQLLAEKKWSNSKGFDAIKWKSGKEDRTCIQADLEGYAGARMALADLGIAVEYNNIPLIKEAIRTSASRMIALFKAIYDFAKTLDPAKAEKEFNLKFAGTVVEKFESFLARRFAIGTENDKGKFDVGCDFFKQCFFPSPKDILPSLAEAGTSRAAANNPALLAAYGTLIMDMVNDPKKWSAVTLREANHLYGRMAEPGEKTNPYHYPTQSAGLRYITARISGKEFTTDVTKAMAACPAADCRKMGPCGEKTNPTCFAALSGLNFLDLEAVDYSITLRDKDIAQQTDWTSDKGFMAPRWGSELMVNARKPYKEDGTDFHTSDTEKRFPFREKRAGGKFDLWDKIDTKMGEKLGLPNSDREAAWKANIFPAGGEVWAISNKIQFAKDWTQMMNELLLTVAAGPSGTTDEVLTLFDFLFLNGVKNSGGDRSKDKPDPVGCYLARAHAFGTMVPYFHHSAPEVMEGADNGWRCRGILEYDHDKPFDKPSKDANLNTATPNGRSIFDFPEAKSAGSSGITNTAVTAAKFADGVTKRMSTIQTQLADWIGKPYDEKTAGVSGWEYLPFHAATSKLSKKYAPENKAGFDALKWLQPSPPRKTPEEQAAFAKSAYAAREEMVLYCICKNKAFDDQPNFKNHVMDCAKWNRKAMFKSSRGRVSQQVRAILRP